MTPLVASLNRPCGAVFAPSMYSDRFTRFASATFVSPSPKEIDRYPGEQYADSNQAVSRIFVDRAGGDQPLRRDEQNDDHRAYFERVAHSFGVLIREPSTFAQPK